MLTYLMLPELCIVAIGLRIFERHQDHPSLSLSWVNTTPKKAFELYVNCDRKLSLLPVATSLSNIDHWHQDCLSSSPNFEISYFLKLPTWFYKCHFTSRGIEEIRESHIRLTCLVKVFCCSIFRLRLCE
jgi:hypothetical protein